MKDQRASRVMNKVFSVASHETSMATSSFHWAGGMTLFEPRRTTGLSNFPNVVQLTMGNRRWLRYSCFNLRQSVCMLHGRARDGFVQSIGSGDEHDSLRDRSYPEIVECTRVLGRKYQ